MVADAITTTVEAMGAAMDVDMIVGATIVITPTTALRISR
jgi:hypothetical protein